MATNSEFVRRIKEASKVMRVKEEDLTSILDDLGVVVEDDDAIQILESSLDMQETRDGLLKKGVKPARLNAGWMILLGREFPYKPSGPTLSNPGTDGLVELIKSQRPATQWKNEELLEAYNEDCPEDVISELTRRAKDEPVIVFKDDNSVDVEASLSLLKRVRSGLKVTDVYIVKNPDGTQNVARTCRVNEWPMRQVEECPVHSDVILADGFCERCQATWKSIPEPVRQAVRIASDLNFVGKGMAIHSLIEELEQKGSEVLFKIPKVKLAFEDMKADGDLPKLKRRLSKDKKNADPFFHKKY